MIRFVCFFDFPLNFFPKCPNLNFPPNFLKTTLVLSYTNAKEGSGLLIQESKDWTVGKWRTQA